MTNVPSWYQLILLSFAAWRVYRLISEDTILERPRRWALRLDENWQKEGDDPGDSYRQEWGQFITCPYCLGAWSGAAWWLAWILWPHATTIAAVPLAISTVLIGVAKFDHEEDE